MGGLSIWHWVIVLIVVLAVFGTAKLRNMGSDLGSALKGFKDAMKDDDKKEAESTKVENVEHKSDQASEVSEKTTDNKKENS